MGISIRNSNGSDAHSGSSASADPARVGSLAEYARLLEDVRRDYDRTEEMYERAVEADLDPGHANSLGNYALFLESVRRDYDRAEEMYERAIAADPGRLFRGWF